MKRVALAVALVGCSAPTAMSPLAARRPYPLHPAVRSASGGPIEVIGAVAHPGVVPYATGITLTCALRLVGGPTMLAERFATLRRAKRGYRIPVNKVIDGTAPDLELAPGDVVVVNQLEDDDTDE